MSALKKVEANDVAAQAPASDSASIMMLLHDPAMSVERIDHAFTLYQRIEAARARKAYDGAFARMQEKIPVIARKGTLSTNEIGADGKKTGNQKTMSKYALFADIMEGALPALKEFGFGLSFKIDQPSPDRVKVTCTISHEEGHREETSFALPIDTTGAKNNVQGWGSSLAYAKRYTASAMLNIVSRENVKDDDDGKAAGMTIDALATLDQVQVADISKLITDSGSNPQAFLKMANAESIGDILVKDFEGLKTILNAKKRNGAK